MDIVTHALIGGVLALPLAESSPVAASSVLFGSLLPDLDAGARVFGREAFLRIHQGVSHGLPVAAAVGALWTLALGALGIPWPEAALAGAAMAGGMALHSALDWTNTYGVSLGAPVDGRRRAAEWVFFIDAWVTAGAVAALWVQARLVAAEQPVGWAPTLAWAIGTALYVAAKAGLRRRAGRVAPEGTVALLPTTFVPWRFLGVARRGTTLTTFSLSLLRPEPAWDPPVEALDDRWAPVLGTLPEFAAMRRLSPAYHVVSEQATAGGTWVHCRDLRTRNFGTRFGALDVELDPDGRILEVVFHA